MNALQTIRDAEAIEHGCVFGVVYMCANYVYSLGWLNGEPSHIYTQSHLLIHAGYAGRAVEELLVCAYKLAHYASDFRHRIALRHAGYLEHAVAEKPQFILFVRPRLGLIDKLYRRIHLIAVANCTGCCINCRAFAAVFYFYLKALR